MEKKYECWVSERCLGYFSEDKKPFEYLCSGNPKSLQDAAVMAKKENHLFQQQGKKKRITKVVEYNDLGTHYDFVESMVL